MFSRVVTTVFIVFITSFTFFLNQTSANSSSSALNEGITFYNQEKYKEATDKFIEAQAEDPENPNLAYNLANSNFRVGRYEQSVEEYDKALKNSNDPKLKQKSYYNQGNAYYRLGYLDKAIQSYKKALELDSNDKDSKFNLEFARKQLEKAQRTGNIGPRDKSQKQNPTENANNPADSKANNENQSDSNAPSSDESDEENQAQQNSDKNHLDGEVPKSPKKAENKNSSSQSNQLDQQTTEEAIEQITSMSKEEAEQWLDSLNEDIKKFNRRQMQGEMKDVFVNNGKDW